MKYVCLKKCVYNGRVYEAGEPLETDAKNVPVHFNPIDVKREIPEYQAGGPGLYDEIMQERKQRGTR